MLHRCVFTSITVKVHPTIFNLTLKPATAPVGLAGVKAEENKNMNNNNNSLQLWNDWNRLVLERTGLQKNA